MSDHDHRPRRKGAKPKRSRDPVREYPLAIVCPACRAPAYHPCVNYLGRRKGVMCGQRLYVVPVPPPGEGQRELFPPDVDSPSPGV